VITGSYHWGERIVLEQIKMIHGNWHLFYVQIVHLY
jgi:hypothetical protein